MSEGFFLTIKKLIINLFSRAHEHDIYSEYPALHQAVLRHQYQQLESLLKTDIDVNMKDKYGYTALQHAAREKDFKPVNLLFKASANLDEKDQYGWIARDLISSEKDKILFDEATNLNDIKIQNMFEIMSGSDDLIIMGDVKEISDQ